MKNKKVLLVTGLLLVLALVFGGLYFASQKNKPAEEEIKKQQSIPKISSEEIGLSLSWKEKGKIVLLEIAKTSDISAVEYELLYKTKDVMQRAFNILNIEKGKAVKEEIPLGTCSSGVCRYDKDISGIQVILKITKTNGKIYQAEASLDL
ncbi:hypothetical protein KKG52_00120 [Patescibacteria group bacterium]|nr:hypothetical protein [Patescibacteria group bacterium]